MSENCTMINFKEKPASKKSTAHRKPLYNLGINDADYIVSSKINGKTIECPFYTTWRNMIARCYCKAYQKGRPTYIGCTVSKDWLLFSNFKKWMERQNWFNNALDKDILYPGNKHYSSETCVFISRGLNNLLIDNKAIRGEYPLGVRLHKGTNNFRAECKVNGKYKLIGCFSTPEEASQAYNKFKSKLVTKIANKQNDIRVKNGLLVHAKLIGRSVTAIKWVNRP